MSQPCELAYTEDFPAPADDIEFCAPFGTDGTCPVECVVPSTFTLSRARTKAGFLEVVGLFPAVVLEDAEALVSRSLADVLQRGNETQIRNNITSYIVMKFEIITFESDISPCCTVFYLSHEAYKCHSQPFTSAQE